MKSLVGSIARFGIIAAVWAATDALAAVTWDGGTPASPNTGGTWSTPVNWDSDALPLSTEQAILPSVTDGTSRTITLDSGQTLHSIRLEQSAATGVNKLDLGGNLTLTTSQTHFTLTAPATASQLQIHLNGYTLKNTGANTTLNAGTYHFNVPGSNLYIAPTSNGHDTYTINSTFNVSADGRFMRYWDITSGSTGHLYFNFGTASALNIAAGHFVIGHLRIQASHSSDRELKVTNTGTFAIASGATLEIQASSVAASQRRVRLLNNAAMNQGGRLAMRPAAATSQSTNLEVTNAGTGVWTIMGDNAIIERRITAGSASVVPAAIFQQVGTLQGSSAGDMIEFNEESFTGQRLTMNHSGTIASGAGSQGAGTASVGALRLKDIDLTMGTTGKVYLDFGGSAAGQYDQLLLQTGVTDPAGAGTLDLSAGGTLQLYKVNGFAPGNSFSVPLVTAGSITGTFATVKLDGDIFTGNELALPDGTKYTLTYSGDAITLTYAGLSSGTLILLR